MTFVWFAIAAIALEIIICYLCDWEFGDDFIGLSIMAQVVLFGGFSIGKWL